jgi:hypothetical protein
MRLPLPSELLAAPLAGARHACLLQAGPAAAVAFSDSDALELARQYGPAAAASFARAGSPLPYCCKRVVHSIGIKQDCMLI